MNECPPRCGHACEAEKQIKQVPRTFPTGSALLCTPYVSFAVNFGSEFAEA
jgi:hypothetical protein